ncbi:flagellar assembly peptidoglycan hydrolase FlgJ [Wenzhouxiangella limi]|uniref:Peptidoglycan hydrolase FlgJ n=1 Tax=Wenzhouxiangella limi TaxID=2707351 RepID=A0A845V7I1_9GAMM|nr:flagellar assembly peptidoglycan hydrolase FlgJ [Wenzhouxiangella limi]NDY97106.1 flagellar assembly peptidoglycan hydrolase FlgJ [Wenzhouxiangella limi]
MSIAPTQSTFFADTGDMAELRLAAQKNDPQATRETAQQFEALFIQLMLKSMRDAGIKSELFDSSQMDRYMELYDRQIALDMAQSGGIGLADVMVEQMQPAGQGAAPVPEGGFAVPPRVDIRPAPSFAPAPDSGVTTEPAATPVSVPAETAALPTPDRAPVPGPDPTRAPAFEGREDFIANMLPLARRAAARLGVPAEAIVAQSALETGWGRHVMQRPDGSPAWAMFGIKAGSDWTGDSVSVTTLEVRDGEAVRERARFRAYASPEAAVNDYVNFLTSRPRYAEVLQAGSDPAAFATGLQRAGYATDPHYASKIERLVDTVRQRGEG